MICGFYFKSLFFFVCFFIKEKKKSDVGRHLKQKIFTSINSVGGGGPSFPQSSGGDLPSNLLNQCLDWALLRHPAAADHSSVPLFCTLIGEEEEREGEK